MSARTEATQHTRLRMRTLRCRSLETAISEDSQARRLQSTPSWRVGFSIRRGCARTAPFQRTHLRGSTPEIHIAAAACAGRAHHLKPSKEQAGDASQHLALIVRTERRANLWRLTRLPCPCPTGLWCSRKREWLCSRGCGGQRPSLRQVEEGCPEAILVPAEQPAMIAQALAEIRRDATAAKKRCMRARERVARSFGVAAWVAAVDGVYRNAERTAGSPSINSI